MIHDSLSVESISACLKTDIFGKKIVFKPIVSSTMDVALQEIEAGASSGTVVICEQQQNGKGRLGRDWVSPTGGVYLSIILFPEPEVINFLTMLASLAITDCINKISGVTAQVKWPNDIVLNGRKLAGILAQSGKTIDGRTYAIIGIGINVNTDIASIPEISSIATSLFEVSGARVSRVALICSLLQRFEDRYQGLEGGEPLWQEWQANLDTIGKRVIITCGNDILYGMAESVNSVGSLMLRLENGILKEIPAGDVTLRA